MSLSLTSHDRVLVVAPHPDDESLATGGLILRALRMGATVRVVFATNGDNNPWPQRWVEKRWRIGGAERERWGCARQQEALAAVRKLGLPEEAVSFLNFPDQGMTPRLLGNDPETLERICRELREAAPTLLVFPSPHDLHPDHNALHVLFKTALERTGMDADVRQLHFLVHCRRPDRVPGRMEIPLSEADRLRKREAILCHETQMALSRKRFVAYARPTEIYYEPAVPQSAFPGHRVREATITAGALTLEITLPARRWEETTLFLALETASGKAVRWKLSLPLRNDKVRLCDTVTREPLRWATVRIRRRRATVRIPVASLRPLVRVYVKLHRRTLFLDDAGWREVPLPEQTGASRAWVLAGTTLPEETRGERWPLPPEVAEPGL